MGGDGGGTGAFYGFDFEVVEPEGERRRLRLAFSQVFTTSNGQVWASTYQGGLFRVEGDKLRSVLGDVRTPGQPLVTQLFEDSTGTVVYRRGSGYGRIHPSGSIEEVTPSEALLQDFTADLENQRSGGRVVDPGGKSLLLDRAGRTWRAGQVGGMTVETERQPPVPVELPQRGATFAVNELLEDREGNVWIASPVNGLVRVRHARVDVLDVSDGRDERGVRAMLEDRAGTWWIANRRSRVIQWNSPGKLHHMPLSNARSAAALFEDRDSRLWVATGGGSIFCRTDGELVPQFVKSQAPSKVRAITQDAQGILWFGASQGLAPYSGETIRQFGREEGIANLDLTVLQPFPGGKVITGCSFGRILLGGNRGFSIIAGPEVTKYQWISGILPVSAKETWVSTLGSGLYLWDGRKWTSFDENDGLPESRLTCVIEDGRGFIWMGTLGGIIRADRKELLAHSRNPEAPVRWLRLDHTDGMPSRECIGGYQPAGWKGRDGTLWFPTGSGITRVHPEQVEITKIPPPVYLQSVRANGVLHAAGTGPITTEPGRARLEFRFVGLGFSAPEKITYRARLAGLNDTWRELGNQPVAAFESVPPGKYTFEVMAVNGDGLRSATPARIPIEIRPHFWETSWFYISVGAFILLIAAGTGWLAARVRMKSRIQFLKIRNAREGERSRIARDLHDDLGASLTEISILAALAAEDAEKTPLQPSLDQLSVKAKHVVGSLDEIVWAVNPREDTLRSLVDYLAAFAREFLDIARIPLRIDVTREIPDYPPPPAPWRVPRRPREFEQHREALGSHGSETADHPDRWDAGDPDRGQCLRIRAGLWRWRERVGEAQAAHARCRRRLPYRNIPLPGNDRFPDSALPCTRQSRFIIHRLRIRSPKSQLSKIMQPSAPACERLWNPRMTSVVSVSGRVPRRR